MMRNHNLTGTVLAIVFLFCHLSLAEGGKKLRRFLHSDNSGGQSHYSGSVATACGRHRCVHGLCTHSLQHGAETTYRCRCHSGWTGDACDAPIGFTADGECHHASDCTSMSCNAGDTMICYLNKVCACAPAKSRRDIASRYLYSGQINAGQSHCGQQCMHGSCYARQQNGGATSYHCTCNHGWTGSTCNTSTETSGQITDMSGSHSHSVTKCGQHQCVHGDCSFSSQNGIEKWHNCACHHGWTGDACDKSTGLSTTKSPNTHQLHYKYEPECNDHGQMTSSGCHCHDTWSGDICQYPPGSGHYDHCRHHCQHGQCVGHTDSSGYYYNCKCDENWHGQHCTNYIPDGECLHASDCASMSCNAGDTVICYLNKVCACAQEKSEHDIASRFLNSVHINAGQLRCGQHLCMHGSCYVRQQNGGGTFYQCKCNPGWTGNACDTSTDTSGSHSHSGTSCGQHQCVNGECSFNSQNGIEQWHKCSCHHGWTGDACDKSTGHLTTNGPNTHQSHYKYEPECNDHGEMTSSGCNCHDSWSGDICQYAPGSGHYDHCRHHCQHGQCVGHTDNSGYYYNCKCDENWHGQHCTSYKQSGAEECQNLHCDHGHCGYAKDASGHTYNHQCICDHGWDGIHCERHLTTVPSITHVVTSPSTSAMSTSTPTTTTTTTTKPTTRTTTMQSTLPPATATSSHVPSSTPLSTTVTASSVSAAAPLSICDHIGTLSVITRQTSVANQNAIECSPGSHTSHEALVLSECSVPQNPSSWQQGANVMADCGGATAIPTYTPLAAFDNGLYSSAGSLSGIFLGCTNNGFKIALQVCGQAPHITELQLGGSNTQNPNMYYTI